MIINREPEPAHWRQAGGGGSPTPGLALRLALPALAAVGCYLVARFLFELWIVRAGAGADPEALARGRESAAILSLWLACGVALLGLMTDRRCRAWARIFSWPVLGASGPDGPRTVLRHLAVIALLCLTLYAVEVVLLKRWMAPVLARAPELAACGGGWDCRQLEAALVRGLDAAATRFAWTHVALFIALGAAIAFWARRARSVRRLMFSTLHGIFFFHRLDIYAVVALAQLSLLTVLAAAVRGSLVLHAPELLDSAASAAPTLAAMFAGGLDNPMLTAVFATGLVFSLGVYGGCYLRLASPYHSLLEAQRLDG